MLTKREAGALKAMISDWNVEGGFGIIAKEKLLEAIDRATDTWTTNNVIARGPNLSSTHMLDEAARALGWRTDWATGDSPITWDLVIEEIRKRTKQRTVEVVDCPECKGRAAVKKREGKRVEAVCLDCGCGMSWGNG